MANEMSASITSQVPAQGLAASQGDVASKVASPPVVDAQSAVSEAVKPREAIRVDTQSVMSSEDLTQAIQSLNDMMSALDRNINFAKDPGTGKDVVRVTDSNTGQTIRQIPSQETLNFIKNLDRMVGLLFDSKT
jgi:flagellar protein FlaG